MSQTLLDRASARPTRLGLIDCDVHHAMRSPKDLHPYLAQRWRDHLDRYGPQRPVPFTKSSPYFKSAPALSRKDTWPPNGGPPGSDLKFLQEQLLDRYGIETAMLHLLSPSGMDQRNQETRRRPVSRDQRMAIRRMDPAGPAAESGHRGAGRGPSRRGRRNRALGRQYGLRPGVDDDPHHRAARPASLLADL